MLALLLKARIPGYTKKDGTYVAPHDTKAPSAAPAPVKAKVVGAKQMALFDHKAPLPADAYANVGKPTELPPAPAPKPGPAKKLMAWVKGKKPDAPEQQVTGAQYGGKTPGAGKPKWQNSLHGNGSQTKFGGAGAEKKEPSYPHAIPHPRMHDDGKPININWPSKPSTEATWTDPEAIATFVPDGPVPAELNGVKLAPWADAPADIDGWNAVPGQMPDLEEPPLPEAQGANGKAKELAAGVVVEEPDGRVWLMNPTNRFGGYRATFPKGRVEDGLNPQASAIKECFEETGLQVEITGFYGDIERSVTVARYYRARRVGGTPAAMGWEAQAVQLVPKDDLLDVLNMPVDHKIVKMAADEGDEEDEEN